MEVFAFQALAREGIEDDYLGREVFSLIQDLFDEPDEAIDDFVAGAASLLRFAFDEDIPLIHKVEMIGGAFVPFYGCMRPAFERFLFVDASVSSIELDKIDIDGCAAEVFETVLLGFAGSLIVDIGNLASLRRAAVQDFAFSAERLVTWSESLYESEFTVVRRDTPLIFQQDRLTSFDPYRLIASRDFFVGGRVDPARFNLNRFTTQANVVVDTPLDAGDFTDLLTEAQAGAEEYVEVTDPDSLMVIDVPANWSFVSDEETARIVASSDLAKFSDFEADGVLYDLWVVDDADELESLLDEPLSGCDTREASQVYSDGLFEGLLVRATDCGRSGNSRLAVAAVPDEPGFEGVAATLVVQSIGPLTDLQFERETRFLASFNVFAQDL